MELEIVRIDGKEYVAGSAEARSAQARLDAVRNQAFLQAHPEMLERNIAVIRGSVALDRIRQDANATAMLARDLVFVSAEVERKVYEEARALQFVRPDTSYPRGAEGYERRMRDFKGKAKVSHTLAGDHPRADVAVEAEILPFRNVTASYGYTVDELEKAAFARVPLAEWKREACIEVIARGIDRIGRVGTAGDPEGDAGLRGLFNNPDVPLITLTTGAWLTATVAQILADLNQIEAAIISQAKDTQGDGGYKLVLPTAYEGRLRTLQVDATATMTVARYFVENSRLIKSIERWGALDSAVSPSVRAADPPQALVLPMDQKRAGIHWPMPISYEEQPPEVRNFEWLVNARARLGGVEFSKPFYAAYVENLD